MKTTEQAPAHVSEELGRQIAEAESRPVNKLSRALVSGLVGKPENSGIIGASREVRELHGINEAEDPHAEVDRLLEVAEASRGNRLARKAVSILVGKPEDSGYIGASRRVRNLHAIKDSLPPKE